MTAEVLLPAIFGLLGTIVGGLITFFGEAWARRSERSERRSSLAHAIAAEIDAYLTFVERRGYVQFVSSLAKKARTESVQITLAGRIGSLNPNVEPFPIVAAHWGDVGLLGPVCADIARFYHMSMGVRETWRTAEQGRYDKLEPIQQANVIESEVKVFTEARELGTHLVAKLRAM